MATLKLLSMMRYVIINYPLITGDKASYPLFHIWELAFCYEKRNRAKILRAKNAGSDGL